MSEGERRIAGRYRVLRELGRGAMGSVLLAEDEELGRLVAIKHMLAANAKRLVRFAREARAGAAVSAHPNVVALHDSGLDERGKAYLVHEYVEGESLEARLSRGPLNEEQALGLFAGLARGLAALHAAGFLHRDIKPANILISTDGRGLLADFGLSRTLSDERERLTLSGTLLGTVHYMAPEQVMGKPDAVGTGADVWALGATLFEATGGEQPFKGDSLMGVLAQIASATPPKLRSLRPELSPALEAICARCLQRKETNRFPSADALADALDAAPTAEAPTRSPLLVAAPLAALLALIGVGAWALGADPAPPAARGVAPLPSAAAVAQRKDPPASTEPPKASRSRPPEPTPPRLPRAEWRLLTPTRSPATHQGLLVRGAGGALYLFAGRADTALDQLWRLADREWSLVEVTKRPRARFAHAMAYDPDRERLVVYGGVQRLGGRLFADLWEFDGAAWSRRRQKTPNPGPRAWHSMAWEPESRTIALFGGRRNYEGSGLEGAGPWLWDGRAWRQAGHDSPHLPPFARKGTALAYSAEDRGLVLFGSGGRQIRGDMWRWQAGRWTEVPRSDPWPPARAVGRLVATPHGLLLFGGHSRKGEFGDLWLWRGGAWEELDPGEGNPGPQSYHGMAYDPERDVITLHAERTPRSTTPATWELRLAD